MSAPRLHAVLLVAFALAGAGCSGERPGAPTVDELLPPEPEATVFEPMQHAVVIVVDTLRADAVAAARTPHLDRFAAEGSAVSRGWSDGTWTVPSVTSLFTGMSVREHGWDLDVGRTDDLPPLPAAPLLAEVLRAEGFATTGLYANQFLAPELGFDRGFDRWERLPDGRIPARVAEVVSTWDDGQRHFLYVHLLGPHSPLRPSEEARGRWEVAAEWFASHHGLLIGAAKRNQEPGVRDAYRSAYHAVVEDTDALVGEILTALEPHRSETAVVFASDHGELLGEHEVFGHGWWVWEPLTHVPVIARNTPPLPEALNLSAIPDLLGRALDTRHAWSSSLDQPLPLVSQRLGKVALFDGTHKGIWHDELQVFSPEVDPGETTPIVGRDASLAETRAVWEAVTPAGIASEGSVSLHPDTVEALRALGYLTTESP